MAMLDKQYITMDEIIALSFTCRGLWAALSTRIDWTVFSSSLYTADKLPSLLLDLFKFNGIQLERSACYTALLCSFRIGNSVDKCGNCGCERVTDSGSILFVPTSWSRQVNLQSRRCYACFKKEHKAELCKDGNPVLRLKYSDMPHLIGIEKQLAIKNNTPFFPAYPSSIRKKRKNQAQRNRFKWGFRRRIKTIYLLPQFHEYTKHVSFFILCVDMKLSRQSARVVMESLNSKNFIDLYGKPYDEVSEFLAGYILLHPVLSRQVVYEK